MNSAKLDKSPRLQRVHKLLSNGGEFSTMAIVQAANVCAVNSIISELRDNGIGIKCRAQYDKRLQNTIYYYSLDRGQVELAL